MNRIEIFTDGSCLKRVGGWAFIILDPKSKEPIPVSGAKLDTTAQAMELTAILHAMAWLSVQGDPPTTIYSDSEYSLNCIRQWAPSWERRGWTKAGGPIKNLELIKALLSLYRDLRNVKLKWIKGHSGNPWNCMADRLAEKARKALEVPANV